MLGTIVFFALLLFLDWLSIKFPGKQPDADPEKGSQRPRQRKRELACISTQLCWLPT